MESEEMKTFWFFRLRFHRAYDSTYDSDFRFSLYHKRSYDSDYDYVVSESQSLIYSRTNRVLSIGFEPMAWSNCALFSCLSTLFHCSTRTFPGIPSCRGLLNSLLTLAGMELGRGERGGGSAILSNNFRFDCLDFVCAQAPGVTRLAGSSTLETFNLSSSVSFSPDVDRLNPAKRYSWPLTLGLPFSCYRDSKVTNNKYSNKYISKIVFYW